MTCLLCDKPRAKDRSLCEVHMKGFEAFKAKHPNNNDATLAFSYHAGMRD